MRKRCFGKKGNDAPNWVVSMAIAVFLLFLILIMIKRISDRGNTVLNTCEGQGGECLTGDVDRPVLPGKYKDCTKQGQKCYLKQGGGGGTGISVGGEETRDGINLLFQTYVGLPHGPNLITFTSMDDRLEYGTQVINSQNLRQSTPFSIIPGRLYGFSGYIQQDPLSSPKYELCSIYIIDRDKGLHTAGDTNFIDCGTIKCPSVKRQPCTNQDKLPTLFFIAPSAYANTDGKYILRILGKKDAGDLSTDFSLEVPLHIGSTPVEPQASNFPLADVHELENGGYLDKEVSFKIENEWGILEYQKVRLVNVQNLDFDHFLEMEQNYFEFDSRGFGIPASHYARITMKNTGLKKPPNPIMTVISDADDNLEIVRERKTCDTTVCRETSFAVDGSVMFKAAFANRLYNFELYPGSCEVMINYDQCITSSSLAEGLNCHWKRNRCTPCLDLVKKCSDYKDEYSCYMNSCNLENDPYTCTWVKKSFVFDWMRHDGCQSCTKVTSCEDYNRQTSCDADICSIGPEEGESSCAWSLEEKKCSEKD